MKRENPIPETKIKSVKELVNLIKNKKTILVASIKNIPASQFQEIGKKLRNKAIIKVPKKNLIFRALDSSENEAIKKLKEQIKDSVAILFSDLDSFELASELIENKSLIKAKAGQEAPEDIEVHEGPTELVPGPAISELGSLGIQIEIEKGKINIKKSKIIVKKGGEISDAAAGIMNKLGIKPFSIGFVPLSAFDTEQGKLYLEIKIDKAETVKELKNCFGKALALAVELDYFSEDTISLLITKAHSHEKSLDKFAEAEEQKGETIAANADNRDTNNGEKTDKQNSQGGGLTNLENSEPLGKANVSGPSDSEADNQENQTQEIKSEENK
ncbi:MAG TPA: 50S ribosomal protein L10 [Candidatus Paceibacterota bacterium]|nr:50S ribosomal protein L10 [Candidatus Paceibacterota bacterium]